MTTWEIALTLIGGTALIILFLRIIKLSLQKKRAERRIESLTKEKRLLLRKLEKAERLSTEDPLTGLGNRRKLDSALRDTYAAARRAFFPREESRSRSFPIALILFDLDQFKEVNDIFGHDAGDKVLKKFALAIENHVRRTDIRARLGGDEFVLLLTDIGKEASINITRRISESFRESLGYLEEKDRPTLSGGIVFFESKEITNSPDDILGKLKEADQELQKAKRGGKNQICGNGAEPLPL